MSPEHRVWFFSGSPSFLALKRWKCSYIDVVVLISRGAVVGRMAGVDTDIGTNGGGNKIRDDIAKNGGGSERISGLETDVAGGGTSDGAENADNGRDKESSARDRRVLEFEMIQSLKLSNSTAPDFLDG